MTASATLATLVVVFLVVGSPFALNILTRFKSNWVLLSNIGQTYGAISALLAALGLAGVVVTVLLQVGETRRARADAIRSRHFELYRMAIEDVSLTEISNGVAQIAPAERKRVVYINLQLEFWLMLWEMRVLSARTLRGYANDLFRTPAGKNYWNEFGAVRVSNSTGVRNERDFLKILDEECAKVPESSVSCDGESVDDSVSRRNSISPRKICGAIAIAVCVPMAWKLILDRRKA